MTAEPAISAAVRDALTVVVERGPHLRTTWRFDFPPVVEQAGACLRWRAAGPALPPLVAIVGGASSGKSTVFDNLLQGHPVSRITAQGHATLGLIVAAPEAHREIVDELLRAGRLLTGLRPVHVDLNSRITGAPDEVGVVYHPFPDLRGLLLCDTPDFTSQAARQEGDILLSLLPWFDRLVVVVDHERWFDRQSIGQLRLASAGFGQQRFVVFNRTREGALAEEDRAALLQQARHLDAESALILEFRRGRGLSVFPPGTLEPLLHFAARPAPPRNQALLRVVARQARLVGNQNRERAARLEQLRSALVAAIDSTTPSEWDCLNALLTPPEREQLQIVARVLRVRQTRQWLRTQTHRVESALRRVPILGALVAAPPPDEEDHPDPNADRPTLALGYFEAVGRRQAHELQRLERVSAFWEELRRWTGLEPAPRQFQATSAQQQRVRELVAGFERALSAWNARVAGECRGASPHVAGALGAGALAVAIVLVAAPGPLSVLTLAMAKTALAAALGKLAVATGAGALLGRHFGRLLEVVQEKLLGSPEFAAVRAAAAEFRALLAESGRLQAQQGISAAAQLVLPPDDPLATALDILSACEETT
ncbi:MAG TPA: hypothetical protein PKK06_09865 [Phycisphaerae bacterium]|nr:hypothetical protein [Phycisphaerae bacterium]HNU45668.1 hypothetical protein [Phycisphaerae bacterium]